MQKRSVLCQTRAAVAHAVVSGDERGRGAALRPSSEGGDVRSGVFESTPAPAPKVWEVEWRGSDQSGDSGSESLEDAISGKDDSGDDQPDGRQPIRDRAQIEARRGGVAACEALDGGYVLLALPSNAPPEVFDGVRLFSRD